MRRGEEWKNEERWTCAMRCAPRGQRARPSAPASRGGAYQQGRPHPSAVGPTRPRGVRVCRWAEQRKSRSGRHDDTQARAWTICSRRKLPPTEPDNNSSPGHAERGEDAIAHPPDPCPIRPDAMFKKGRARPAGRARARDAEGDGDAAPAGSPLAHPATPGDSGAASGAEADDAAAGSVMERKKAQRKSKLAGSGKGSRLSFGGEEEEVGVDPGGPGQHRCPVWCMLTLRESPPRSSRKSPCSRSRSGPRGRGR